MTDDPRARAWQHALSLLAYRARTRRELEARLVEKGHAPDDAAHAVARLAEAGLLDDARLAESVARSQSVDRARSARRVRRDLERRGVEASVAKEAVARAHDDAGTDDAALARRAAERKARTLTGDATTRRRRLLGFLARQGFGAAAAYAAAEAVGLGRGARDAADGDAGGDADGDAGEGET